MDTDVSVVGSPSSLARMLLNLASNGCEAVATSGRVEINATQQTLTSPVATYETIQPGDYGALRVCDSGSGICDEDLGRVFDPLFSTKSMGRRSGTGLGLAIVYGLVKDANGFVDIKTSPAGTCFSLYFPNVEHAVEQAPGVAPINGKSVLVVGKRSATDGHNSLAMLLRRPNESFYQFLERLDVAVGRALEEEVYTDEING